jgi:hypothetical protein
MNERLKREKKIINGGVCARESERRGEEKKLLCSRGQVGNTSKGKVKF